jgi:hypothetical protein
MICFLFFEKNSHRPEYRHLGGGFSPGDSLLSGRHARPEHGIERPTRSFLHSPSGILPLADHSSGKPDLLSFRRSRHLEMAFRSPPAAARFRTSSHGSSFPACLFDATAEPATDSFGSGLHSPISVAGGGRFIALHPLPALLPCRPGAATILAPHRDRNPSGSSLAPFRAG